MKICEGIQRMSIYEDDMESILLADYICLLYTSDAADE